MMTYGDVTVSRSGSTPIGPRLMLLEGGHAIALFRTLREQKQFGSQRCIDRERRENYEIRTGYRCRKGERVVSTCGMPECCALAHARVERVHETPDPHPLPERKQRHPRVPPQSRATYDEIRMWLAARRRRD